MSLAEKIIALEKALNYCEPVSLMLRLKLHNRISTYLN